MFRINVTKVRWNFADVLNQVAYGKEHIILQRQGKDLIALIPIEDFEALKSLLEEKKQTKVKKPKKEESTHEPIKMD